MHAKHIQNPVADQRCHRGVAREFLLLSLRQGIGDDAASKLCTYQTITKLLATQMLSEYGHHDFFHLSEPFEVMPIRIP